MCMSVYTSFHVKLQAMKLSHFITLGYNFKTLSCSSFELYNSDQSNKHKEVINFQNRKYKEETYLFI